MNSFIFVPETMQAAGAELRRALAIQLDRLPKTDFIRAWSAAAYLFPGLHPDGYADAESGWPRVLRRYAAEAWRRAEADELSEDELYPSDAQWSGLFDRMTRHTGEETARRLKLAVAYGECAEA